MKWVSVDNRLPEESTVIKIIRIDVWIVGNESDGFRVPNAKLKDGVFYEKILTEYGDFRYDEPLSGVTHWLLPEPPNELNKG